MRYRHGYAGILANAEEIMGEERDISDDTSRAEAGPIIWAINLRSIGTAGAVGVGETFKLARQAGGE